MLNNRIPTFVTIWLTATTTLTLNAQVDQQGFTEVEYIWDQIVANLIGPWGIKDRVELMANDWYRMNPENFSNKILIDEIYEELKKHNNVNMITAWEYIKIPNKLIARKENDETYIFWQQEVEEIIKNQAIKTLENPEAPTIITIEKWREPNTNTNSEKISLVDTSWYPLMLKTELWTEICHIHSLPTQIESKHIYALKRMLTKYEWLSISHNTEEWYENLRNSIKQIKETKFTKKKWVFSKKELDLESSEFIQWAIVELDQYKETQQHIDDYLDFITEFKIETKKVREWKVSPEDIAALILKSHKFLIESDKQKGQTQKLWELTRWLLTDRENGTSKYYTTSEEKDEKIQYKDNEITKKEEEIIDKDKKIITLEAEIKNLQGYIVYLETQLSDAQYFIQTLETSNAALRNTIVSNKNLLDTNNRIIDELKKQNEILDKELKLLQNAEINHQQEITNTEKEHNELLKEYNSLLRKHENLSKQFEKEETTKNKEMNNLKKLVLELENNVTRYQKKLKNLELQNNQNKVNQSIKTTTEIEKLEQRIKYSEENLKKSQAELKKRFIDLQKVNKKLKSTQAQLQEEEKESKELKQQMKKILRNIKSNPESWNNITNKVSNVYVKNPAKTVAEAIKKWEMELMFEKIDAKKCTGEYWEKRKSWRHKGYDIPWDIWKPIKASAAWFISKNAYQKWWAWYYLNTIEIVTDGSKTIFIQKKYFHLNKKSKRKTWETYQKWDTMWYLGTTWWSTWPHLHFEMYWSADWIHWNRWNPTELGKLHIKK